MIEESLFEKLATDLPELSDRIYPLTLPAKAQLPALTFQRMPGRRIQQHQSESNVVIGRFQFVIWSSAYETGKTISAHLRGHLQSFRGTMGIEQQTLIDGVILDDDRDDYEPELPMYMVYIPATIIYHEEV